MAFAIKSTKGFPELLLPDRSATRVPVYSQSVRSVLVDFSFASIDTVNVDAIIA